MKAVRMLGNEQVSVVDIPDPQAEGNQVSVKIMSSALCGSERHVYYGSNELPGNAGHEAAGTVHDAGTSKLVSKGDRVALHASAACGRCRECWAGNWVRCQNPGRTGRTIGNHSQFVQIRDDLCLPLPDDISFDTGALLGDVMGTPFRAIKRLRIKGFDRVLIMGQGPIGLAATMLCKFLNADVTTADVNEYRLQQSLRCGADRVHAPTSPELSSLAPDVALDCSGNPDAQTLCLDTVKPGGRVALIGVSTDGPRINTTKHFILKELEVIGSWYSTPVDHLELIDLVRRGLSPEMMITHRFGIDEAPKAFTLFFNGEAAKVMLTPWE
ncbi:MAG: zinc-binding dehydrogenase [Pseudomonadales bacterium]|jgi:threonine dehydrogenase-like Zn-dependent dehydrogenase|nr:zinc-binding dehydrogenase [Pseudomonadales bacterium]MDP7358870.1 zinc-binding dehydrogenase [Pseudomonadales bacterium]MDP7595043.1 zinc-binding dehydrogenase [Pseudomonadales bacterium]HJN52665.1 zinc-binding dehydrogenase [Pseudomonadales bacterium]|tara:strand:- start:250 stop:1230 length:981 start_codon:yes stop_codon:yes gene_type:complete